jgi:hypothetical protein
MAPYIWLRYLEFFLGYYYVLCGLVLSVGRGKTNRRPLYLDGRMYGPGYPKPIMATHGIGARQYCKTQNNGVGRAFHSCTSRKQGFCPGSRGPLVPVLEPGQKGQD